MTFVKFCDNRRICSFCHDLDICYNQRLLKQHELEGLSRAELSTLMLQSDSSLLPLVSIHTVLFTTMKQ